MLNPVCSLPEVLSPVKVVTVERKEVVKLPVFYTNLMKATKWNQDPVHDGIEADDSNLDDSDFNDSDYEIGFSDDDLFADNVDVGVFDEGATKGCKMFKWKKAADSKLKRKQSMTMSVGDEDESTEEEEIALADSDEGSNRNRFREFR